MANIKGKVKTLAMVKNVVNVKNCTNFGCMAIDGKKAWGLKTASGMSTVLYIIAVMLMTKFL